MTKKTCFASSAVYCWEDVEIKHSPIRKCIGFLPVFETLDDRNEFEDNFRDGDAGIVRDDE